MDTIPDKIVSILARFKELPNNEAILENADILSFIISLIPIPGIEQIGQVANKIIADQQLKVKFFGIKEQIFSTNKRIDSMESELERIGAIAKTVASVTALQEALDQLILLLTETLSKDSSEFIVETSHNSIQAIINQMIQVDWVSISAIHHSQNILLHTKIQAKKTHLKAIDNSINIVDGTEFKGEKGAVDMSQIGLTGDIHLQDASVALQPGSSLILGARPEIVSGNCPKCRHKIEVEKYKLTGYASIQCPSCKSVLPFTLD